MPLAGGQVYYYEDRPRPKYQVWNAYITPIEGDTTGLYPVRIGPKWGYADRDNNVVIEPRFEGAGPFSEGLAAVWLGRKKGYIDQTGNLAIQPHFDDPFELPTFSGGATYGRYGSYSSTDYVEHYVGEFLSMGRFSEGIAAVQIGLRYGYVDHSGHLVIQPQFALAGDFSEGRAPVVIGMKFGYINTLGNMVWTPQY
jgi:hypothetical protein